MPCRTDLLCQGAGFDVVDSLNLSVHKDEDNRLKIKRSKIIDEFG